MLLQVLSASGPGDAFHNIGVQLEDGHWVLAFSNAEDADYATLMVDQHAAKLRAFYCAVRPRPPLAAHRTEHLPWRRLPAAGSVAGGRLSRDLCRGGSMKRRSAPQGQGMHAAPVQDSMAESLKWVILIARQRAATALLRAPSPPP